MPEQMMMLGSCINCNEVISPDNEEVLSYNGQHLHSDTCAHEYFEFEWWTCVGCEEQYHSRFFQFTFDLDEEAIAALNERMREVYYNERLFMVVANYFDIRFRDSIEPVDYSDGVACSRCVVWCDSCENAYLDGYNADTCCEEYENDQSSWIGNSRHVFSYSYRPQWVYHYVSKFTQDVVRSTDLLNISKMTGKDVTDMLFIGMELEMERAYDAVNAFYDKKCDHIMSTDNKAFVYFKTDGSLSQHGVEMVTHPATLDAFMLRFPWHGLEVMHEHGARSYAYASCGMHFHISKSSFTPEHMWKFIRFQMRNYEMCIEVAQRNSGQWASWDNNNYRSLPDVIKGKERPGNRYVAINLSNDKTIELRYFKGNILKHAIQRNLEFIQSMYDYTKGLSLSEVMRGHLSRERYENFLATNSKKYSEIANFLVRNVSEPDEEN